MTALPIKLAELCIVQAIEKPDVMDWSSDDYDRMINDLLGGQDRLAKIVADYQISVGLDDHAAWEDAYGIAEAIAGKQFPQLEQQTSHDSHGWLDHTGGDCPIVGNALVSCRLRSGDLTCHYQAQKFRWQHRNQSDDILAYRMIAS